MSVETPEQTDQRLRTVLANAELAVHHGWWCFTEFPLATPPILAPDAVAVVRDEECWSVLAPTTPDRVTPATELFGLMSFHFPPDADNSGFVGWLATELKVRLGTGVFVVCGHNSARGGVYDYWGCPANLLGGAVAVIDKLR